METVLRPLDQTRVSGIEGHWGRDPRAAAPVAPAVANPISPTAEYGYDAMLGLWVPVNVSGGFIVEKFSELIASLLSGILGQTADLTDDADATLNQLGSLLDLVNTRLGGNQSAYLWQALLNSVNGLGFRKILATDAGAYTAPAAGGSTISFTGVNLNGRTPFVAWNLTERRLHRITAIVDPVPPAAGTITLETPVGVANTIWIIPYMSVPHAYSNTTDAIRSQNIAPEWSHYVEPTVFISQTAATANNTYQFGPIPCLDYGRFYFQIVWSNAAGIRTIQFRLYGKMDNAAWAAAGAIPAPFNIDTFPQYTPGGLAFGSPPFAGGATPATSGIICGRLQDACMYDSLMVEMVVTNSDGNNTTVTGYYGLSGNGR